MSGTHVIDHPEVLLVLSHSGGVNNGYFVTTATGLRDATFDWNDDPECITVVGEPEQVTWIRGESYGEVLDQMVHALRDQGAPLPEGFEDVIKSDHAYRTLKGAVLDYLNMLSKMPKPGEARPLREVLERLVGWRSGGVTSS